MYITMKVNVDYGFWVSECGK